MIQGLVIFFTDLARNDGFTALRLEGCIVFISSEDATLFVGREDCWDFALRLRINGSCSSSETKGLSESPETLRLLPTFVSSDPEEPLTTITLGALLRAFLAVVARTTSTFLWPRVGFSAPFRNDGSLSSTMILSSDSDVAFCDLECSATGAGDGDRLESSSSSLF